ncbi:MAG: DUF4340 domain-containing protein [Spirochaetales bacterium]|nr:DUF4340 domain-containing protein [Spirochaetales bacterium]
MKKKKQLIIALAVLVLLGAGYLLIPLFSGTEEEAVQDMPGAEPSESYVLTQVSEEDLASLTIENRMGRYTLVPGEEGMILTEPEGINLNQQAAGSLSFGLRNLSSRVLIEENSSSPEAYGLETPSGRLTVNLTDGSSIELKLGSMNPSGSDYYVMKEGDPSVYLLPAFMAGGILNSVELLRDRTLPVVNLQNLQRLTITGERTIDIVPYFPFEVFSSSLSPLLMIKPYKRPVAVNTQIYSESLETFSKSFRIIDFPEADDQTSGLENPLYTVYMQDGDGAELTIAFGNRTDDNSAVYCRVSGIDAVVTLPADAAVLTSVKPVDMADRFVRLISIDHVSEVRVVYGKEKWISGINWLDEDTGEFSFQGKSVEEDSFKKMYQEMLYLLFEGELPEPFIPSGTADFSITYVGDDQSPGQTSAEFYDYNEDFYAVSIDANDPEFLIGKYQVESLAQYIRDYEAGL